MHRNARGELIVRAFMPRADTVAVVDAASGEPIAELPRQHDAGLFAGPVGRGDQAFHYRLRMNRDGRTEEVEDPYAFPPVLGSMDVHLLAEGTHLRAFEKLGAHPTTMEGVAGVARSEEHTSELQSLMRTSYAVFCLKKQIHT